MPRKKPKNPHAVALGQRSARKMTPEERSERGRQGGAVGGPARAAVLTPEQRSEIASKAGKAGGRNRPKNTNSRKAG